MSLIVNSNKKNRKNRKPKAKLPTRRRQSRTGVCAVVKSELRNPNPYKVSLFLAAPILFFGLRFLYQNALILRYPSLKMTGSLETGHLKSYPPLDGDDYKRGLCFGATYTYLNYKEKGQSDDYVDMLCNMNAVPYDAITGMNSFQKEAVASIAGHQYNQEHDWEEFNWCPAGWSSLEHVESPVIVQGETSRSGHILSIERVADYSTVERPRLGSMTFRIFNSHLDQFLSDPVPYTAVRDYVSTRYPGLNTLYSRSCNGSDPIMIDSTDPEKLHSVLSSLVLKGHLDNRILQRYLAAGADINYLDRRHRSLAYVATAYGFYESFKCLAEAGADLSTVSDTGRTPLHVAAVYNRLKIAKSLLDYGIDVNARTETESTPLYWASRKGHVQMLKLLLDHGADVNLTLDGAFPPLLIAIRHNQAKVVKLLLEANADVNVKTDKGRSALYLAKNYASKEVVRLIEAASSR